VLNVFGVQPDRRLMLMLDGNQVATGALSAFIPKDPNDGLQIGGDLRSQVVSEAGLPHFTGLIESIRIFNYETP